MLPYVPSSLSLLTAPVYLVVLAKYASATTTQWKLFVGALQWTSVFILGICKRWAMPTVVLMDVSLSMTRPVSLDGIEEFQRKNLAVHGLNMLFEHMASNYRLEFTSLMAFSSLWELLVPFTRDYNALQVKCGHVTYLSEKSKYILFPWKAVWFWDYRMLFFSCTGGSEQPGRLWQNLCWSSSKWS